MPLRNARLAFLLAACVYVADGIAADSPQDRSPVSELEIKQAIDKLKADPNLATERKVRTLKWKNKKDPEQAKRGATPAWLKWIGDFFSWLGETARVFVWLAAALLAALLAIWIVRFVRGFDRNARAAGALFAPTHVRDLDIRPESLPPDIGKAALDLWLGGEHRAALSLLYRGLLSRLAHKYSVPIRHSSTEGECLRLVLQHMPARSHEYATLLIRTWQGAVYGGVDPSTERVRDLCANFALTLDQSPDVAHSSSASSNA